MKKLAIIPARGGSKRIPKKNIKSFLGKPIISFSIEVALNSKLFDEVMVSTDDSEIAKIATEFGANIPFLRSAKNSSDIATTIDVIDEVIEEYDKLGKNFDYVCCIYPTAPLINKVHLEEGFNCLVKNDYYSVVPVVSFSYPIWRALKINSGLIELIYPENVNYRSQDLENTFHDAGQWYWLNRECIKSKNTIFNTFTGTIVLDEMEVQDIDNMSDWKLAELKYIINNKLNKHVKL